jgi:hypothetical protein
MNLGINQLSQGGFLAADDGPGERQRGARNENHPKLADHEPLREFMMVGRTTSAGGRFPVMMHATGFMVTETHPVLGRFSSCQSTRDLEQCNRIR